MKAGRPPFVVAIGAHSRKVGKTSVVCALIRATPEISWTAVKISSNKRGLGGFSIEEETAARRDRDTGRFLEAGARRAIWIRACDADMAAAAAAVETLAEQGGCLVVESNRIVEHLQPHLFALALDSHTSDFKESAQRVFRRADGYILSRPEPTCSNWPDLPLEELSRKPLYPIAPPDYMPTGLLVQVRRQLTMLGREEAA